MKYKRFEDLPVWQAAMDLALRVDRLTKDRAFRRPGDLASQLQRAALSISNNIAEGFERGSTSELLMFLYIARGSAGEVRSMLCFIRTRTSSISNLKSQISEDWPNPARAKSRPGQSHFRTATSKANAT